MSTSIPPSKRRTLHFAAVQLLLAALVVLLGACSPERHEGPTGQASQALAAAPVITSFAPAQAAQGALVTLTGTGFTGATAIAFNGVAAASFNVVSDTSLTATIPPLASTGKITVTTPSGLGTSKTSFKVLPTLSGFSPASGGPGVLVVVQGTGLSGTTAVKFGAVAAAFTVISDVEVDATVPAGAPSAKITVTTPGGTATSAAIFVGAGPTVTSFSPAAAKQTATVTLTGTGLLGVTSVTFGGIASTSITPVSTTQIKAVVPLGAPSGIITVTTPLGAGATAAAFNVLPTISSFNPLNGVAGTLVTVVGTGLSGATNVAFGAGSGGAITVIDDTQLTVVVPPGATTSKLTLTTNGGSVLSAGTFTLQAPPAITSFTPASGAQGAAFTVTGTGLLGVNDVRVNGVAATITSVAATSVKATIPTGATSGPIYVANGAGSATSATNLVVLPKLLSFAPSTGPTGTSVIVTGTGFTGATQVKFGTAVATIFQVLNDATITATVPALAATGKIAVTTPAGSSSSATNFTVITAPKVTALAPVAAAEGATISLTGSGFLGTSAVLFNGTPAASFTVVSSTSITAVVPSGATTGKVQVTNAAGSASSAASFSVLPAIVGFQPAVSKPGGVVTLSGTSLAFATSVKVGALAAAFSVVDAHTISVTLPNGAQTAPFSVTTPDGTATSAASLVIDLCLGVTCSALDACHSAGVCAPASGVCSNPAAANGTACSDGDGCTQNDACQGGACVAGPTVVCASLDACHVAGSCDPVSGACSNPLVAQGTSCGDGNACNGNEVCDAAGKCTPGTAPVLDDGDPCTTDVCDPAAGVTHTAISGCGVQEQPLPPPPGWVDTAPASLSVAGVDFIDPNHALSGLTVTVSALGSAAAPALLNADATFSFEPTGALPDVVYARIPLTVALPASSPILLFSRAGGAGSFTLQSVGRVVNGGASAVVALKHFSQQALIPIGKDAGSYAPNLLGRSDPNDDHNAIALSVAGDGRFGFMQTRGSRIADGGTLNDGFLSGALFRRHFTDGTIDSRLSFLPGGGVLAQASSESVWDAADPNTGESVVVKDDLTLASGSTPTISADGKAVAYVQNEQVAVDGMGVVSVTPQGGQGTGPSSNPVLAGSGRFVAFRSFATDLDPNSSSPGVYVRDLSAPQVSRLAYADPGARLADCISWCDPSQGCDPTQPYPDGCQLGQIPFAVSDGGRYVFLEDETSSDPLAGRVSGIPAAVSLMNLACRNAYRFDRSTGTLDTVAYGDWFAIDRGGRTIASHPCRPNDFTPGPLYQPGSFQGAILRDINLGLELSVDPGWEEIYAALTGPGGPFEGEALVSAWPGANFLYEQSHLGGGAVSGDGNRLAYILDGVTVESFVWEVWSRPLPSPTQLPSVAIAATTEFTPFTVSYSNMLAETTGDLLALVDARGRILQVQRTFGSAAGVANFNGVPAGNYFIDAYYQLDGDPGILKFRTRAGFTIAPKAAALTLTSFCEYEPFDVGFANFLGLTPDDRVVLKAKAPGPVIEAVDASGATTGTLHFTSRLDEGDYRLEVEYGTPGEAPGTRHFNSGVDITIAACTSLLGGTPSLFADTDCRLDPVLNHLSNYSYDAVTTSLSSDGARLIYVAEVSFHKSLRQIDRRTGQDTEIAPSISGFGASRNGRFCAYSSGSQITLIDLNTQTQSTFDAQVTNKGFVDIAVANDGRTLAAGYSSNSATGVTEMVLWDTAASVALLRWPGCQASYSADSSRLLFIGKELDASTGDYIVQPETLEVASPGSGFVANQTPLNVGGGFVHPATITANGLGAVVAGEVSVLSVSTPIGPAVTDGLFLQDLGGGHRIFIAPLDQGTLGDVLAIASDDTIFRAAPPGAIPGLYQWGTDRANGVVFAGQRIFDGLAVGAIAVADQKRRVAFASANQLWVAPY